MDIIIWAIDDFNALALLRQLGQCKTANILFLIIGKKKYAFKSKYCSNFIETNSIEEGYNYLLSNYCDKDKKPIIFTSGDNVMIFIDQHKNELEPFFYIPGCKTQGNTEYYTDKYNMWKVAKEVGMYVPDCVPLTKTEKEKIKDIDYPCLIKPSHETPGLYNEFKFRICKSRKKLLKTLKYVRDTSLFVVQDFIECKQQLLIYGCRTKDRNVVVSGSMLVDRFSETGSSSHGIISNGFFGLIDSKLIISFLEKIDYVGLFSFEFGILNNKAYFFEINLRNDGTSNFFYQSGANIPLCLAYSFLDIENNELITTSNNGVAIDELYDYENVIKKRISKKDWSKELKMANYFKYYDQDDLEPYNEAKKGSKKQMKKDIFLKKYRLMIVYIFSKFGLRK